MEKSLKIKNRIKEVLNSQWIVYVIFSIILIVINFSAVKCGDDIWFQNEIANKGLIEYLTGRYHTWTSRLIIEATLVTFANIKVNIIFFEVINILMFNLLLYSISELFVKKENKYLNWFIMIGILALPLTMLNDAGTIATSVNYLWAAALGLYALIPIKKSLTDEKCSIIQKILSLIALIYAANQEQMVMVLFLTFSTYMLYLICKKQFKYKINVSTILMYLITIANLIFTLTCPGNFARKEQETANWYPCFENYGILSKAQLGITSMMKYLIIDGRVIFMLFTFIIAYTILKKYNNLFTKIVGIIPLVGSTIFNLFYNNIVMIIPNIKNMIDLYSIKDVIINATNCTSISSYIMLGIYGLVLLSIFIDIYLIFEKSGKMLVAELVYLLGLATRMAMGLSPTVFVSAERTSLFLYISFIILSIFIMSERKEKDNNINLSYLGIVSIGILKNLI